jgi:hypothetical protein
MATPKALDALKLTKEALVGIRQRLKPVLQRLTDNECEETTSEAQTTVALSIGMMQYMGARLRGLDKGRKPDDPLRKELNNMKRVLAEIKKKHSTQKKPTEKPSTTTETPPAKSQSAKDKTKDKTAKETDEKKQNTPKTPTSSDKKKKKEKGPNSDRASKKRRSS